jgi:hypothetical protein
MKLGGGRGRGGHIVISSRLGKELEQEAENTEIVGE